MDHQTEKLATQVLYQYLEERDRITKICMICFRINIKDPKSRKRLVIEENINGSVTKFICDGHHVATVRVISSTEGTGYSIQTNTISQQVEKIYLEMYPNAEVVRLK